MVTLEFDEFVRQFRERTAQRMVEFEKALAKAQTDMEKTQRKPRGSVPPSRGSIPQRSRSTSHRPEPVVHPAPPVTGELKTPVRNRRRPGPVQGVLKKS